MMVENDNDAEMGTNMDMVKGELVSSYFVGRSERRNDGTMERRLGTQHRIPTHAKFF